MFGFFGLNRSPCGYSMDGAKIERILCLLIILYRECWCLKLTGISVPRYKLEGEDATLECHYELSEKRLYAVKWYKMEEEFYRYVLRSNPPMTSYPVEGVSVDSSKSDRRKVVLRKVTPLSSGVYKCEVSAEAPSFSSATAAARMTVQHLPENGPEISGEEKRYTLGDELSLNCSSGWSYPATVLHWYINDLEIQNEDQGLVHFEDRRSSTGLLRSTLGLDLRLVRYHFRKGKAELRCLAVYPLGGEFPEGEALTAGGSKLSKPTNHWEALITITLNSSSQISPGVFLLLLLLILTTSSRLGH